MNWTHIINMTINTTVVTVIAVIIVNLESPMSRKMFQKKHLRGVLKNKFCFSKQDRGGKKHTGKKPQHM